MSVSRVPVMTQKTPEQMHHVIVYQIVSVLDYSTTCALVCQEEEGGLKEGFPARELDVMAYIF